jgi:hypothetical protein
VAGLSRTRKFAIAGRVAGQAAARHPYFRAGWAGVRVVIQVVGRAVRQLWLEITGFTFLVFAVLGAVAAYREYPGLETGDVSYGRLAVISLFTLMFLWFGVSSLWRARRKT